jgi:hypothetical protein
MPLSNQNKCLHHQFMDNLEDEAEARYGRVCEESKE